MREPHGGFIPEKSWTTIYEKYLEARRWADSSSPAQLSAFVEANTPIDHLQIAKQTFENALRFSDLIGRPQDSFHSVLVTGTGGKGSVATMLAAILRESGQKTGLHVSPYVQLPNEKIIVDGRMISPSAYTAQVNWMKEVERTFETTLGRQPFYSARQIGMCYEYFQQAGVSWAVLEIGRGGRFDPNNIVNADASIITNVDMDHVSQLGPTLEDIAWHKAGIIKANKPVITSETKPSTLAVIEREAKEKNAKLYIFEREFSVTNIRFQSNGMLADIATPYGTIKDLSINLAGEFQVVNAAVAIMTAQIIADNHKLKVNETAIRRAMESVTFAGRMEKMQDSPLVVIDGAHNPQKLRAAATTIHKMHPGMKKVLIIGMVAEKDITGSLAQILPYVDKVIATSPNLSWKESCSADEIAAHIRSIDHTLPLKVVPDVQDAIRKSIATADNNTLIFVTGSLYMLERVRDMWYPQEEALKDLEYS